MLKRTFCIVVGLLLCLCLAQAAFFQGAIYNPSGIIPANRQTVWQPGVTYNAIPSSGAAGNTVPSIVGAGYGYPTRTQCGSTLTPIGGGSDDTVQINSAISACTSGHYVLLSTGVFNINGNGVAIRNSGVTLRGSGPGKGLSTGTNAVGTPIGSAVMTVDSTATQLIRQDRATTGSPTVVMGYFPQSYLAATLLTGNAVQGAYSVVVTNTAGLSVGNIVIIDHNTDYTDPNVFWNANNDPPGAEVIGSITGSVLTVTQVLRGAIIWGTGTHPKNGLGNGMQFVWRAELGNGGNIWNIDSAGTGTGGVGTYNLNGTPFGAPYASQVMGIGYGTRRQYTRQGRSVSQLMEIASIVGSTITFTTPFHYTFTTANSAQLTQLDYNGGPQLNGMGIENLMLFGGSCSNIFMGTVAYSWIKGVEAAYADCGNVALYECFRCELRDSFIHESPSPNPGGGGYLLDIATGTTDSLIENNVTWNGNKNIVMRGTGGGNVAAYNYFDDAYGSTYPQLPEAGANAGHAGTPNMELLEGNYSHQFTGDAFWGASINITAFRNQLSTIRVAHPPLNTYTSGSNSYGDYGDRYGINIQAGSYYNNFVGNVIGFTASASPPQSATSIAEGGTANLSLLTGQTAFAFESVATPPGGSIVPMWNLGYIQLGTTDSVTNVTWSNTGGGQYTFSYSGILPFDFLDAGDIISTSGITSTFALSPNGVWTVVSATTSAVVVTATAATNAGSYTSGGALPNGNIWRPTTYQTLLRQGNWDWLTQTQTWLGIGGTQGSPLGTPQTIPNSLYTASIGGGPPAFLASSMYCPCTWPWVNPATGVVTTLPAKARFDNGATNGYNTLHHIELTEPANDNDPAQDIARALNAA